MCVFMCEALDFIILWFQSGSELRAVRGNQSKPTLNSSNSTAGIHQSSYIGGLLRPVISNSYARVATLIL